MRAGFEGDVDRGAARRLAGLVERIDLGVRAAAVARAATPDHPAILDDHAAHGRIGPGAPERPARQRERRAHHRLSP
jgi:hypothetical protein